jgi:isochorismate synthase EntC
MYNTFQDYKNEGNNQFNSTFREKPIVLTTAEAQRWKEYNNYEMKDHKNLTKEALKMEINNMTHKIALAREAKLKATAGTTYGAFNMTSYGNWKAPEIE